jgi:hypothetical protein
MFTLRDRSMPLPEARSKTSSNGMAAFCSVPYGWRSQRPGAADALRSAKPSAGRVAQRGSREKSSVAAA